MLHQVSQLCQGGPTQKSCLWSVPTSTGLLLSSSWTEAYDYRNELIMSSVSPRSSPWDSPRQQLGHQRVEERQGWRDKASIRRLMWLLRPTLIADSSPNFSPFWCIADQRMLKTMWVLSILTLRTCLIWGQCWVVTTSYSSFWVCPV
jgi:hypothetical protein